MPRHACRPPPSPSPAHVAPRVAQLLTFAGSTCCELYQLCAVPSIPRALLSPYVLGVWLPTIISPVRPQYAPMPAVRTTPHSRAHA